VDGCPHICSYAAGSFTLEFGQGERNQVFRSKVFLRASGMPAIVYILDVRDSKTGFLAASLGLSKVQFTNTRI